MAASEDEHDKTKLLQWHAIELMLSLNDSFWIILATRQNEQVVTLFYSKPKVKMRQNSVENFIFLFEKGDFYLESGAIAPNVTPQLRH